jgi:hypothetical protein
MIARQVMRNVSFEIELISPSTKMLRFLPVASHEGHAFQQRARASENLESTLRFNALDKNAQSS